MAEDAPSGIDNPGQQGYSTIDGASSPPGPPDQKEEGPSDEHWGTSKTWFVNPTVCWRHPRARIFVVVAIMGLDFWIYGEDPVNDSHVEYNFVGLGHIYGFLFLWPSEGLLVGLRLACIAGSLLLGMYVSRQWVHHRLLRDRMKLTMFGGNKGTLLIMLFGVAAALYGGALLYNLIIPSWAKQLESRTYAQIRNVGKAFQIWSVFLDIMSIVQIVDGVYQDRRIFPGWASRFKDVWIDGCRGYLRVIVMWAALIAANAASTVGILNTGQGGSIQWEDTSFIGGCTEVSRTLLLNLIIICDLLTVAQDWEFPTFNEPLDIKIAGTFTEELSCTCVADTFKRMCSGLPDNVYDFFNFSITGPWLTYGPLILVMMADLGCAKTQFMYVPSTYGQYAHPDTGRIWNIVDQEYLLQAYTAGVLARPELIAWTARRTAPTSRDPDGTPLNPSAATDVELNARYISATYSWALVIPGVLTIALFVYLVRSGEKAWKSHAIQRLGTLGQEVEIEIEHLVERVEHSQIVGTIEKDLLATKETAKSMLHRGFSSG